MGSGQVEVSYKRLKKSNFENIKLKRPHRHRKSLNIPFRIEFVALISATMSHWPCINKTKFDLANDVSFITYW